MLSDAIDLGQLRRALVVKLRHHGDVLLASPVISALKAAAPHIEIDALVYSETADMLSGHPDLAELFCVDRGWKARGLIGQATAELGLLRRLRGRRPELLIHLTGHPRGAWLAKSLGCRYAVAPALANKGRWWRRAFTHHYKLPRATPRHTVEINLDALRRIGVQPARAARALCLVPGGSAEAAAHRWLETLALPRGAFVHVHASSRWLFKCWPAERYAELIDCCAAAGLPALLTAAPDTRELAMVADIAGRCRDAPANLAGKLSLKELAAVCRHARLFIGVDSAPMHIAAAMGTPVVALFGPSGEHEWHPWQVPHRVVALDWSCRPCGNDGCGGGKRSECLTELPVDAVWQAAQELLACTSR